VEGGRAGGLVIVPGAPVAALSPDVVLLNVEIPLMTAEEALERILEASPASKVIMLTMYDEPRLVREFVSRGASAYLVKSATKEELISAVLATSRGDDRVIMSISRNTMEQLEGRVKEPLSGRELEILLLVARGMSNNRIASTFHLSEGTVKRHLTNIYNKLGVYSRGEATQRALSEGWISPRELI
jgi:DNA-binding NarL/FixJ family response regulator